MLEFNATGRHVIIDQLKLDILDFYITKKAKYGVIVGPSASGKTTLAKFIAQTFSYELVEWESTIAQLKEKLATEEGAPEEVPYA